jgi:putative NADPH-quinone reductase
MSKDLVLVFHSDLAASIVNRRWVRELGRHPERYTVHDVHAAYPDGRIDVEHEQGLVEDHERLILQFPIYWFSCPPLVKTWLDEVLTNGWAYGPGGDALARRPVALGVTAGIRESGYRRDGRYGHTLAEALTPFEMTFQYTGAEFRSFYAFYGAEHGPSPEAVARSARGYLEFLERL